MGLGSPVPSEFFSSRIRHRNALTEKAWKDVVQGPDSRDFKISLWRGVTTATWGENHFRWRHHPTCDAAFSPAVALFCGRWNKSRTKRLLTNARAGSVHNAAYIAISGKVMGKSAREYPERYCGLLWVHCFSKKFERMTREAMDVAAKVDSTATLSETVYWSYPILRFGIVACTFFPTMFLDSFVLFTFSAEVIICPTNQY